MSSPSNLNFFNPMNFLFVLKRAPTISFFLQRAELPGISLNAVDTMNPFVKVPYAGDHMNFEPLIVEYKVDEDLKNYLEIFNWMQALTFPKNFNQYKAIQNQEQYTGNGVFSDITLTMLGSSRKKVSDIVFVDAFPVALSGIKVNTTDTDINYSTVEATFRYSYFTVGPDC